MLQKRLLVFVAGLALVIGTSAARGTVTFDWATVGDPGNTPFFLGTDGAGPIGAVSYVYRISKYEVTNSQYTQFLNAVDPTGANSLQLYFSPMSTGTFNGVNLGGIDQDLSNPEGQRYAVKPGRGNKPVTSASPINAMRFSNWLHNGQGNADTASGAYTIPNTFTVSDGDDPINGDLGRNAAAQFFLPSDDEWYKAAYYKGGGTDAGYWTYATRSDAEPTPELPAGGTNSANFYNGVIGDFTDVGAYTDTFSAYGTFDQTGNAEEWAGFDTAFKGNAHQFGGGIVTPSPSLEGGVNELTNLHFFTSGVSNLDPADLFVGFRIASRAPIPEPATLALVTIGMVLITRPRRRTS